MSSIFSPSVKLDSIGFGNPCVRDYVVMQKETYLDRLLPDLQKKTPPANSSAATNDELLLLTRYTAKERMAENNLYDENLLPYIKHIFMQAGASGEYMDTITQSISEDVLPLIVKLKFFFQRPRPSQLAYLLNINLFPDFSYFVNSPSYPSCHVTLTYVTCEVLGNHYPEAYEKVQEILKKVALSRLHLGVHYPSDNDMAMYVGKQVVANSQFKAKYEL